MGFNVGKYDKIGHEKNQINIKFDFTEKHVIIPVIRGVAQPGRVLALGARCRRFEPSRPDQKIKIGCVPIFVLCPLETRW